MGFDQKWVKFFDQFILELHFHFTDMCALTDANFAVINLSTENGRTGSDEEDWEHTHNEGEDGTKQKAPPLP